MRIAVLAVVLGISNPALAMNWEGHDDWMLDFPPASALREAIPEARPLPSRDCPTTAEQAAANRYEQIPLPRHRCGGEADANRPGAGNSLK
ncbi:MAG: hypothetical protein KDK89_06685 [Alphaproteobacteria bacterium]|nr:hypothetical protein [Alphaproteobacteria bacterium]